MDTTRQIEETVEALETLASPPAAVEKDLTISQYARMFLSGADVSGTGASLGGPSNAFRQSLWVYRCISVISSNAARVPIRLSKGAAAGTRAMFGLKGVRSGRHKGRQIRTGEKAHLKATEGEIVETGDLYELLARPNPEQTWHQFIAQTVGLLYAHGRVHWLFDEMAGRRPVTMYAVGGRATSPLVNKDGKVERLTGWKFTGPHGRQDTVLLDECLTFQLINPDDPHAGLAPRVPANLAIVSDYNASLYNAAMFGNSAEPGVVLKTDAPFNPEQDEQIKTTWQQRHRGAAKAKALAVLWGGLDFKSITSTMHDMQFDAGKRLTRTETCAAYGVAEVVAGFYTDANYQFAREGRMQFWQETEMPLLDQLADGVVAHLCSRFDGNLDAWFDVEDVPIVQEMRLSQLEAVDKLWAKGTPLADLNVWADLGLPDRPQHEVGFLPINVIPADQAVSGEILPVLDEGTSSESEDSLAAPGTRDQAPGKSEIENGKLAIDKATADRLWDVWQRSFAPLAKRCAAMLANHYHAQGRQIVKLLKELLPSTEGPGTRDQEPGNNEKAKSQVPSPKSQEVIARILVEVFDNADEKLKLQVRLGRFSTDANELGLRQSLTEAGLEGEVLDTKLDALLHDRRIIAAARSDSIRFSTVINDSTRNQLRRHLLEGIEASETPVQLADRVQSVMNNCRTDALRISRNTVSQTMSRARREGRVASGVFTHEIWLHSRGPGERREGHVAAERTYAADPKPIGEPFIVNGYALAYPRDPNGPPGEIINCQCLAIGKRIGTRDQAPGTGQENSDLPPTTHDLKFVTYADMLQHRGPEKETEDEQGKTTERND